MIELEIISDPSLVGYIVAGFSFSFAVYATAFGIFGGVRLFTRIAESAA